MVDQLLEAGHGGTDRLVELDVRLDLFEEPRRIFPAAQDLEILVFGGLGRGQAPQREFARKVVESRLRGAPEKSTSTTRLDVVVFSAFKGFYAVATEVVLEWVGGSGNQKLESAGQAFPIPQGFPEVDVMRQSGDRRRGCDAVGVVAGLKENLSRLSQPDDSPDCDSRETFISDKFKLARRFHP